MTAYIGYDNAFEQSGVTIAADWTEPTGFEVENSYDYKTHTAVKDTTTTTRHITIDAGSGNTITADYMGVIGHNLFDAPGATISCQHSDNAATYTTLVSHTVAANEAIFEVASATETHRYWRIRITHNAAFTISHISFGQALECRPIGAGFRPPVYEHYESINAQGNAANYLGRSIKRAPMDLRIRQQGIDPSDFRTDWVPFLEHAAQKPFFFCWDYENYSDEAVYCWTERPQQPSYPTLCHMAIDLSVKAIKA